jgi:hypothetical protein
MTSYSEKLEQILELIDSSRLLAAKKAYVDFQSEKSSSDDISELLDTIQPKIDKMMERAAAVEEILRSTSIAEEPKASDGWLLGAEYFGIKTFYRVISETGLISVLMMGTQTDLPLFELLAVIHEVDLFKTFIPFCNESSLITKVAAAELVAYFKLSMLLLSRDACIHAYGADCLFEENAVVLVGHSVDSWPGLQLPFEEPGWLGSHLTMEVSDFNAVITLNSSSSASTRLVCTVDPKFPLPQTIINFAIKKLAGLLLYLVEKEAHKIQKDKDCAHARKIRENKAFYVDWLMAKMRVYCEHKGWERPEEACLKELDLLISPLEK